MNIVIKKLRVILWHKLVQFYPWYLRKMYKMDIGSNVRISWRANLDITINPRGIHIGDDVLITRGVYIMAHDAARGIKRDVYIGANCFIGIASIILPGVHIGNNCIVGTGAVVTKDFPDNSIIAGNPAKRIKENTYIK